MDCERESGSPRMEKGEMEREEPSLYTPEEETEKDLKAREAFSIEDLFSINPPLAYFYGTHVLSETDGPDSLPEDPLCLYPRMKKAKFAHGRLGEGKKWRLPHLVTDTNQEARPGYSKISAKEYLDDQETLVAKVKVFAEMVRRSRHTVAYTGAGISTASGISDYASKERTLVTRPPKRRGRGAPEPSFAHYAMAAMGRQHYLDHWVQQNHDGLPQKAGYPQSDLNEIHGSLFDPSNPIVDMKGEVRGDLHEWLNKEVHEADLVVVVGSSLCGMSADRLVERSCKSFDKNRMSSIDKNEEEKGSGKGKGKGKGKEKAGGTLGSVIIGYQKTPYDDTCALRFYAKIDEVFVLLAHELQLQIDFHPKPPPVPESYKAGDHVYLVPYDPVTGQKTPDGSRYPWNLGNHQRVRLVGVEGDAEGTVSNVADVKSPVGGSHYGILCNSVFESSGEEVRGLGGWWVNDACLGVAKNLPCVNVGEI